MGFLLLLGVKGRPQASSCLQECSDCCGTSIVVVVLRSLLFLVLIPNRRHVRHLITIAVLLLLRVTVLKKTFHDNADTSIRRVKHNLRAK